MKVIVQKNIPVDEIGADYFWRVVVQASGSIQQLIQGTPTSKPTILPEHLLQRILPTDTLTLTNTPLPMATSKVIAIHQFEIFFAQVQEYSDWNNSLNIKELCFNSDSDNGSIYRDSRTGDF